MVWEVYGHIEAVCSLLDPGSGKFIDVVGSRERSRSNTTKRWRYCMGVDLVRFGAADDSTGTRPFLCRDGQA
jgi:hypothetical protein